MRRYLDEVRHAVESLIPLIWAEHAAVEAAGARLAALEAAAAEGYRQAQFIIENDLDDEGIGTGLYWETYFGADKERHHAEAEVAELKETRDTRKLSRGALSYSLLQIAKQGLSQVHVGLEVVPPARDVLDVPLKDLIWQGRNQGAHWEQGNFRRPVVDCFSRLAAGDPVFADYRNENMAFNVVAALAWRDWATFEADLLSLG